MNADTTQITALFICNSMATLRFQCMFADKHKSNKIIYIYEILMHLTKTKRLSVILTWKNYQFKIMLLTV